MRTVGIRSASAPRSGAVLLGETCRPQFGPMQLSCWYHKLTHQCLENPSESRNLTEGALRKEIPALLPIWKMQCKVWTRACSSHSKIAWITAFSRKDEIATNSSYIDLHAPKCHTYCACLPSNFPDNALLWEGYHTIPLKWMHSAEEAGVHVYNNFSGIFCLLVVSLSNNLTNTILNRSSTMKTLWYIFIADSWLISEQHSHMVLTRAVVFLNA